MEHYRSPGWPQRHGTRGWPQQDAPHHLQLCVGVWAHPSRHRPHRSSAPSAPRSTERRPRAPPPRQQHRQSLLWHAHLLCLSQSCQWQRSELKSAPLRKLLQHPRHLPRTGAEPAHPLKCLLRVFFLYRRVLHEGHCHSSHHSRLSFCSSTIFFFVFLFLLSSPDKSAGSSSLQPVPAKTHRSPSRACSSASAPACATCSAACSRASQQTRGLNPKPQFPAESQDRSSQCSSETQTLLP
mmetsp:Transcript_35144/g.63215  ORF Transcript_35144/g.63215 Transcript_35144/m.63215 type:complete len:239 (+) Transcript_35144:125-841(+)